MNIFQNIAISGKKQSGKDATANIIQCLTSPGYSPEHDLSDKLLMDCFIKNSPYEIKKFADKLKDIICILINCTREQLELEEFKNQILGDEWNKYVLHYSNGTVSKPFFNINDAIQKKQSSRYHKSASIEEIPMTVRWLLQNVGTEAMRNVIHPNIWINATFSEFTNNSNWIITDCRFTNELIKCKQNKFISIRINRDIPYNNEYSNHPSETELDNSPFDYVIDNNGTYYDLICQVREILIKEKIIFI